jgi:hypothetical protein
LILGNAGPTSPNGKNIHERDHVKDAFDKVKGTIRVAAGEVIYSAAGSS